MGNHTKAAFAIYFCCKNFYYLLIDRKFSILNDIKIFFISRILLIWLFLSLIFPLVLFLFRKMSSPTRCLVSISGSSSDFIFYYWDYSSFSEEHAFIASHHNSTVGHMGIQSTIKRLLSSGLHWKFMRQRVQYFVKILFCATYNSGYIYPLFENVKWNCSHEFPVPDSPMRKLQD